jgi:short-subunit dehydrogenase involved in D-alanine esterification of teichoic acids
MKKETMDIVITAKNASDLDSFIPVEGTWRVNGSRDDVTESDIVEAIANWMDSEYPTNVLIFHADGRAITSELPSEGTFIALRTPL